MVDLEFGACLVVCRIFLSSYQESFKRLKTVPKVSYLRAASSRNCKVGRPAITREVNSSELSREA